MRQRIADNVGCRLAPEKAEKIGKCGAGDAEIDAGMDDLADGGNGRMRLGGLVAHHGVGVDIDVLQHGRAAGGGALAETVPVIDDLQAVRFSRQKGEDGFFLEIERRDDDPIGKKHAGRIIFAAVDAMADAIGGEVGRLPVLRPRLFDNGAGEKIAGQRPRIEEFLLLFRSRQAQRLDELEMALRHLGNGAVGFRKDGDDIGENGIGNIDAVIFARHRDPQKSGLCQKVQFRIGQDAVDIPVACPWRKFAGKSAGDIKGFLLAGDAVRDWPCPVVKMRYGSHGPTPVSDDVPCLMQAAGIREVILSIL